MKITKKALAILLSILMLAAVMPIAVSAAGAIEYSADGVNYTSASTLADAFASVSDGGYVRLNDNITTSSVVTVDKNVTFFGNGYTVTRTSDFTGSMFEFIYSGSSVPKALFFNAVLDGNRSSLDAEGPILRIKGGHVSLTAVSLINNVNNENWDNNTPAPYACYGGAASVGTMTGELTAELILDSSSKIANCASGVAGGIIVWKNADVVSNGANFKSCSSLYGDGGAVSLVREGAKFTMNGGSITDCYSKGWGGAICNEIGTLTLKDAVIKNNYVYGGGIGGGVFANQYKADGTNESNIILSGSCVITDNYSLASDGVTQTASNLYIYTKDSGNDVPKITIADDFDSSANVSITVDDSSVNASEFLTGDLSKINNNLVSDTEGYFYSYDCGGTYKWYLMQYVNVALEAGATPVLVTPVSRMYFDGKGRITPHHDSKETSTKTQITRNNAYVEAVRQLAKEKNILLLDGFEITKSLYEKAYADCGNNIEAKELMFPGDSTHNNKLGGFVVAGEFAKEIKKNIPELAPSIIHPKNAMGENNDGKLMFTVDQDGKMESYDKYWTRYEQSVMDSLGK